MSPLSGRRSKPSAPTRPLPARLEASHPVPLIVVDASAEVRARLVAGLRLDDRIRVAGALGSARVAPDQAQVTAAEVVIIDADLEGAQTAVRAIARAMPRTAIIATTREAVDQVEFAARAWGASAVLAKPFPISTLLATIRSAWSRAQTRISAPPASRLVAVYAPQGGAGASTVAANLATAAALSGRRTVLVDVAVQGGDAGLMTDVSEGSSLAALIAQGVGPDQVPDLLPRLTASGLQVITAPPGLREAEVVTAAAVESLLVGLRTQYEVTVVDCPSSIDELSAPALTAADVILLVGERTLQGMSRLKRGIDVLEAIGVLREHVTLVINHVHPGAALPRAELEARLGLPVTGEVPNDARAVGASIEHGEPLLTQNREHPIAEAIATLAAAVVGSVPRTAPGDDDRPDPPPPGPPPDVIDDYLVEAAPATSSSDETWEPSSRML